MQPATLKNIFQGKVIVIGIGNTLRGDDGLGPALIKRLSKRVKAVCLDVGNTPENYTGKITKENPDTILIVDALHLGLAPGEYAILNKDEIAKSGLTTHDLSPQMFIDFLENQTKARIYILGVQPENVSFGAKLSDSVNQALEKIVKACTKHT